jgi:hypothetical protein
MCIHSYSIYYRNRLNDQRHTLTTLFGELCEPTLTERELKYLQSLDTGPNVLLEFPPNFVKCVRESKRSTKFPKSVIFQGFRVSTAFPNNVVLTDKEEIVLVTDIETSDVGNFNPFLTGHRFESVKPAFQDSIGNSRDISFFNVGLISRTPSKWKCSSVVSKCFISPDFRSYEHDVRLHDFRLPLPEHVVKNKSTQQQKDRFESGRSIARWFVQAIELPSM